MRKNNVYYATDDAGEFSTAEPSSPETETDAPPEQVAEPSESEEISEIAAKNPFEFDGRTYDIPEPFFDKEKKTLNLGALLKSQADLREQVSQKSTAPEKYDFGELGGDEHAALVSALDAFGRQEGLAQDRMDLLVSFLNAAGDDYMKTFNDAQIKAVNERFGDDAKERADAAEKWLKGILGDAAADPFVSETLNVLMKTAGGVFLADALKSGLKTPSRTAPSAQSPAAGAKKTPEELDALVADTRYKTDAAYRAKVEREFERTYG